jgi:NTE family protein
LKNSFFIGFNYKTGTEKLKFWNDFPEGIRNMQISQFRNDFSYSLNTLNDRNYPSSGAEIRLFGSLFFDNKYYVNYSDPDDTLYISLPEGGEIDLTEQQFNDELVSPLIPDVYGKFMFNYCEYIQIKPNFQLIPTASAGFIMSSVADGLFDNFKIGGTQMVNVDDVPFFGLNYSEFEDENFLLGGLFLQNIFFRNIFVKYGINYILHHPYFPLNDFGQIDVQNENSLFGYGVKFTYKSLLGPVSFGMSSNTKDNVLRWYIGIGYSFNYKD